MNMSDQFDPLFEGSLVGDYRIERVLGEGSFSISYLAVDITSEETVVIKEYLPLDIAIRDGTDVRPRLGAEAEYDKWRERFLHEARSLEGLSHPNIVNVRQVFEANNTAYIVMDHEEGETLDAILIAGDAFGETDFRNLALPLIDGLDAVHKVGLLHGNIEPSSIRLRDDRSPVLLDFGVTRQATSLTPGYAAIEQYTSHETQGPWTDLYSLAAVLYRIIAGVEPMDAPARLLDDRMPSAADVGGGVYAGAILHAVDQALSVRPPDRPQSAAEWRPMFDTPIPLPGRPPGFERPLIGERLEGERPAKDEGTWEDHDAEYDQYEHQQRRRQRLIVGALVGVPAIVAAGFGWMVWDAYQNPKSNLQTRLPTSTTVIAEESAGPKADPIAELLERETAKLLEAERQTQAAAVKVPEPPTPRPVPTQQAEAPKPAAPAAASPPPATAEVARPVTPPAPPVEVAKPVVPPPPVETAQTAAPPSPPIAAPPPARTSPPETNTVATVEPPKPAEPARAPVPPAPPAAMMAPPPVAPVQDSQTASRPEEPVVPSPAVTRPAPPPTIARAPEPRPVPPPARTQPQTQPAPRATPAAPITQAPSNPRLALTAPAVPVPPPAPAAPTSNTATIQAAPLAPPLTGPITLTPPTRADAGQTTRTFSSSSSSTSTSSSSLASAAPLAATAPPPRVARPVAPVAAIPVEIGRVDSINSGWGFVVLQARGLNTGDRVYAYNGSEKLWMTVRRISGTQVSAAPESDIRRYANNLRVYKE